MTIVRVRLADEDRKQYGGDEGLLPAELVFDVEWLKDLPAGELDELEREMDLALASLLPQVEDKMPRAAFARRAVAFLAVRQAGNRVSYDDFQPRLLRAEFVQEDTGNPPAGPSGVSSEA